jgi:hypothetical protein
MQTIYQIYKKRQKMAETMLEEDHMDHPLQKNKLGVLLTMEDLFYRKIMGVKELNDLCLLYAVKYLFPRLEFSLKRP